MRREESHRGVILTTLVAGLAMLALPSLSAGQEVPGTRIEDLMPRYGGYVPFRGYPGDSGAPIGGYTPFGVQGPEAGWLKVDYGLGYDDFAGSYWFGSDVLDGLHRNNNTGFGYRPLEYGRGVWNNYGRPGSNPPTVWYWQTRP